MKIGCHVSISGGIQNTFERADSLGCESLQIFTQNQRQWKSVEYDQSTLQNFHSERKQHHFDGVPIIAHASYLINLCAQEPEKLEKSRRAFIEELKRCDQLGIAGLVIHPGAHGGNGEEWGIAAIADSINYALDVYNPQVQILLETTAGQGTGIGSRFAHLKKIMELVILKPKMGICVDTCHIFAAGYDIRSEESWADTLQKMDDSFGLEQVAAFHLNDSKKEFNSHRDRHAPIAEGYIGAESFEILMQMERFKEIPGILEVPGGDAVFMENIKRLKNMRGKDKS